MRGVTSTEPLPVGAKHPLAWYSSSDPNHGGDHEKPAFTTFDAPGADGTFAWSINAAGVITGDYIDDSARGLPFGGENVGAAGPESPFVSPGQALG